MNLELTNTERIILKILVGDKINEYEDSDYEERDLSSIPLYKILVALREKLTKLGAVIVDK
jgi:hypothetical protein